MKTLPLYTVSQIAAKYGINPRRVRIHVARHFLKTGASYVLTGAEVEWLLAVIAAARPGRPRHNVDK